MHVGLIQDCFFAERYTIHSYIEQNTIVMFKNILSLSQLHGFRLDVSRLVSDSIEGDKTFAGEVIIHCIQSHLVKYGDGGSMLGKLYQQLIWKFLEINSRINQFFHFK